ncbi:hypothetical protein [Pseudoalteromonas sp.]|uniref:hypothetical protein n=1 Tax=Pseudoalteromonas sp. TaxID=53249 RepID=UPI00263506A0|nr:hypothetical protein [Pseudoalteromonas sp.]MCP4585348.1 hypothetical protein [Pseudoalteromonas sp.]
MRITFKNENNEKNIKKAARAYLESTADTLTWYYENGTDGNEEDIGPMHEYGLSFDYVEADEEEGTEDYFRFQMSWGGPSDELRFYKNGLIEYVYLDWFCGIGFDVSNEDWAVFTREYFIEDIDNEFNRKREEIY